MKKRYFYVVVSFMRKDIANSWRKVDFTFMKGDGSALFPLMEAINVISEGYSEIADPATIQFDNCIEKSEIFYAVRAKFKERFPEASSSTLGKLARKAIKINKEKK